MGSSSDDESYYEQPPIQGPPVSQMMPGAPPPPTPSFLPGQAGQYAQGLSQQHLGAIDSYDAAQRAAIEAMYAANQPQGTSSPGATDPEALRAALAMAIARASEDAGRAPMNRAGGRMPWDEETGAFVRNPDWRPTNRAGLRASSPGWGGSLAGKLA